MSRLATIIAVFCLSLGPPGVRAEIFDNRSREAAALQKVLAGKGITDSTDDHKWRAFLATALHQYCDSVLVQVPRNTPEDDRWLNDENLDLGQNPGAQGWEQRFERVLNSVENARDGLRRVFSECSSISNQLTTAGLPRASQALLWVRLSRLFWGGEIVRLAEIVGLKSKHVCPNSLSDIFKGRADHLVDRNAICNLPDLIHAGIVDHAVIPLLEGM